jgi:hypothetical protein
MYIVCIVVAVVGTAIIWLFDTIGGLFMESHIAFQVKSTHYIQ